jgi:hypothetical protein
LGSWRRISGHSQQPNPAVTNRIRQICHVPYSGSRALACWTELWIVANSLLCSTITPTLASRASTLSPRRQNP